MPIDVMYEEALKLSDEERTELIVRLLGTFEDDAPVDPEHEAAWTAVIDRRLREAREGKVELADAEDVMLRVHAAVAVAAQRVRR